MYTGSIPVLASNKQIKLLIYLIKITQSSKKMPFNLPLNCPKASALFGHAPTHQEAALEIGPLDIFRRHSSREIIIRGVRPVSDDAKAEIDSARRSDGSLDFSRLSNATLHQIIGAGELINGFRDTQYRRLD